MKFISKNLFYNHFLYLFKYSIIKFILTEKKLQYFWNNGWLKKITMWYIFRRCRRCDAPPLRRLRESLLLRFAISANRHLGEWECKAEDIFLSTEFPPRRRLRKTAEKSFLDRILHPPLGGLEASFRWPLFLFTQSKNQILQGLYRYLAMPQWHKETRSTRRSL